MSIPENQIQRIKDVWEKLADLIREIAEKLADLIREIEDRFRELIGEISEKLALPTSKRYRFIKKLSKVTGIDQKTLWKKTSIYRIRSNC